MQKKKSLQKGRKANNWTTEKQTHFNMSQKFVIKDREKCGGGGGGG